MIRIEVTGRMDQSRLIAFKEKAHAELSRSGVSASRIRKIIAIAIELAQNIQRYGPIEQDPWDNEDPSHRVGYGAISIVQNDSGIEIVSRNRIDPPNRSILVSRLESIRDKDDNELDRLFHEQRRGEGTERGAGLGFIEIARNSNIGLQWRITNESGTLEIELRAYVRRDDLEKYLVDRGPDTLGVVCDAGTGEVKLEGSSYPEDAFAFFEPIGTWIESYLKGNPRTISLVCSIDYLNSSSSKSLFDLFDLVERSLSSESSARVTWKYPKDDPDARVVGEEFAEDVSIPFMFEEIG